MTGTAVDFLTSLPTLTAWRRSHDVVTTQTERQHSVCLCKHHCKSLRPLISSYVEGLLYSFVYKTKSAQWEEGRHKHKETQKILIRVRYIGLDLSLQPE